MYINGIVAVSASNLKNFTGNLYLHFLKRMLDVSFSSFIGSSFPASLTLIFLSKVYDVLYFEYLFG
jgi:hypothetical protein